MTSAEILSSNPRYQDARRVGRTGAVSTEQARFDKKHRGHRNALKRALGSKAMLLACLFMCAASLGVIVADVVSFLMGGA